MDNIWAILLILLGIIGAFLGGSYLLEKLGNTNQPDGELSEPEKATIALSVEPANFNPAKGETVKITVKTDKTIDASIYLTGMVETSALQYYLPPQGSAIGLPPNNDTPGYPLEWNGTDRNKGEFFKPGNYRVVVTEKNGARAEHDLIINGIIEGLNRQELKGQFPWPQEIVVGLSELKPLVKLSITIVNPNDFPSELSSTSNFFPAPREITFEGIETEKISAPVVTQDPGKIEPYKMEFTIDYSDYFKTPFIRQKTIEGKIKVMQGGLFPEPPEIPIKIHLNESGAILYKSGSTELGEYLAQLSEEKGWGLTPITDSTPEAVQEEVRRQHAGEKVEIPLAPTIGPFKNLLIIGSHADIPFFDETGALKPAEEKEFDKERVLDQVYYGNVDDDTFIELSVGRLPTSNVEELKAYFEGVKNREDATSSYVYVTGQGDIYREQDVEEFEGKGLSKEQLAQAFIRKQFLYTGFSPRFDGEPHSFWVEEFPEDEQVVDDFYGCIVPKNYFSFSFHKACGVGASDSSDEFQIGLGIFSNMIVFTKNLGENEDVDDVIQSYLYSSLPQKVPINFKAGESFKDYLNVAVASEFNHAEKYYALYGDPSNIIKMPSTEDTTLFDSLRRVKIYLEGEQIKLEMPKLNPNDFFFLGKDKPFSEKEIDNIKAGNFAAADAAILEKDAPFVTSATKRTPSETYMLVLDKDEYADNDELYTELMLVTRTDQPQRQLSPMQEPQDIYQKDTQKGFKFPEFKRAALEIWKGTTHAEVLEGWLGGTYKGKTSINGAEYETYSLELSAGEDFYPRFLDSSGTVKITQNKDNTLKFEVTLSGLEKTKNAQESNVTLNPKHLRFDSYKLVFESQKTGATEAIYSGISKTSDTITKGPLPDSEVSGFDTISLYGETESFASFDFMAKPILSARIRDDGGNLLQGTEIGMENTFGFLNYPNSIVSLELYNRQNEEGYSEVLFKITGVDGLSPLAENKVILLQTTDDSPNKGRITPSVTQAVRKILEENPDPELAKKFPDPENILLLDGDWVKGFFGHFVEGAYFFGNRITLVPFSYGQDKDFDSVKNAFVNADFAGSDYEGEKLFMAKTANGKEFEIDADLEFLTGGTYTGAEDQKQHEQSDVRFYFQFGLEDLFTLVKEGANEANYYTLSIDGFKDGFEKPLPPQPLTGPPDFIGPPEPKNRVVINKILVGGKTVPDGSTLNTKENSVRLLSVEFEPSVEEPDFMELIVNDAPDSSGTWGPYFITSSLKIGEILSKIAPETTLSIRVKITENGETYESEPVSLTFEP